MGALVIVGAVSCSCKRSRAVQTPAPVASPLPLTYSVVETAHGRRDEPLPLVLALHGRGDQPKRFGESFTGYQDALRVVLLEAPIDEGKGRAWFVFRNGYQRALEQIEALLPRLRATHTAVVEQYGQVGKPLIMGFSQGAMLSYAAAARYPTLFAAALPVSGVAFDAFLPGSAEEAARMPPVFAMHGGRDEVIALSSGRSSAQRLRSLGVPVRFDVVPEAPHWINAAMRVVLHENLRRALEVKFEAR